MTHSLLGVTTLLDTSPVHFLPRNSTEMPKGALELTRHLYIMHACAGRAVSQAATKARCLPTMGG